MSCRTRNGRCGVIMQRNRDCVVNVDSTWSTYYSEEGIVGIVMAPKKIINEVKEGSRQCNGGKSAGQLDNLGQEDTELA